MAFAFPPIYILDFKLTLDELHQLERAIPSSVYDITEAELIIGNVHKKQRAKFELARRNLHTEDVREQSESSQPVSKLKTKEKLLDDHNIINLDSDTESEVSGGSEFPPSREKEDSNRSTSASLGQDSDSPVSPKRTETSSQLSGTIKVLNLDWYRDSKKQGMLLATDRYLVYEGRKITTPVETRPVQKSKIINFREIIVRAQEDTPSQSSQLRYGGKHGVRHGATTSFSQTQHSHTARPPLLKETTSEHEDPWKFPPIPDFLQTRYSCQRPTPLHSPNEDFVDQLKKIKKARILTKDDIGVRAYSTVIASLSAYPFTLTSYQEVHVLPGCGEKIANLYQEWRETGQLQQVDEIEADSMLRSLHLFYDIYGVAATTAREFYQKGWRDLNDVITHWDQLDRVQKVGIKYYDEFLERIPRPEVERIALKILEHANKLREGFQMVIVGGYRRGQVTSGDVDVIISHPDEEATLDLVDELVWTLEETGYITHTLKITTANSKRNQEPVKWRSNQTAGTGFDTLDSALCVWQDIEWPDMAKDLKQNSDAKNPSVHRRVDIIISPWKTAGCAIVGWSGGTTFERDLRWYCKHELGLKFDSSGVRDRATGNWVNVEENETTMLAKEKKVFESLKLEWREPTERCTG